MTRYGILLITLLVIASTSSAQSGQNVPGTNQHDESWDIPGNHYPTIQEQNAHEAKDGGFRESVSNFPNVGDGCEFDAVHPVFGGRKLQTWDRNLRSTEVSGSRKVLDRLDAVLRTLEERKLVKADAKIAEVLKTDSRSALGWSLKGEILRRQDRLAEAQVAFDRASTLDSHLIFPAIGQAQIAANEGAWERARDRSADVLPSLFYRLRGNRFQGCTAPVSYRQFVHDQLLLAVKISQEAFDHTHSH